MPKWKPVVLDNANFFNDVEGLVGIEVLEDGIVIKNKNNVGKGKEKGNSENSRSKKLNNKKRKNAFSETLTVKSLKKGNKKDKKAENVEADVVESENEDHKGDGDLEFAAHMKEWLPFGLRKEILQGLHEKKFYAPTAIQRKCVLGAITSKESDIVGAAETGSGKTYAYGIPVIQSILTHNDTLSPEEKMSQERDRLQAVVVTPTRELAVQVKAHLTDLCKHTDIGVALVVGGLAKEKQERILKRRPEIVVGTPGRLWELFNEGNTHLKSIPRIRMLVIDEADRMLEAQHFAELGELLEKLNDDNEFASTRRNFVFSATLTFVHEPPAYHLGKKRKKPKQKLKNLLSRIGVKKQLVYDLSLEKLTPESLSEWKITCQFTEKDYYLVHFLQQNPGRAIIFCNSIGCVRRLANLLNIMKLKPLPLHANMEQKQRLRNLEKFRDSSEGLLLATDVAARGLDIPQVAHVVHYQVPRTAESYVHRSGRTARQTRTGAALLLVSVEESHTYRKLMRSLKRVSGIEELDIPLEELAQVKKIVHLARDIDQATLALKKTTSSDKWFDKVIQEMDIVVDDDERPEKTSDHALRKLKKELSAKEKELTRLMTTPVLPRGFSTMFPGLNNAIQKPDEKKIKLSC